MTFLSCYLYNEKCPVWTLSTLRTSKPKLVPIECFNNLECFNKTANQQKKTNSSPLCVYTLFFTSFTWTLLNLNTTWFKIRFSNQTKKKSISIKFWALSSVPVTQTRMVWRLKDSTVIASSWSFVVEMYRTNIVVQKARRLLNSNSTN